MKEKINNKDAQKNALFGIRSDVMVSLLLVIVTLSVYWQVTNFEFIGFDDPFYITKNPHVKEGITFNGLFWAFTSSHSANWHPLTWLSHMLDVQLFGMKASSHHFINLLFHTANSLLLFLVFKKMTGGLWQSAFVAALFALHPLHIESVAWISERKDVLSTFFLMVTLWCYVRYVENRHMAGYLLVLFFFALGLMAKPMLVTLPFVLLLIDYWPLERFQFGQPGGMRFVYEKIPFLVLSAASCIVTYYVQQGESAVLTLPFTIRIENALVSYVAYIGKMIWPIHLAVLYPHPGKPFEWKVFGACLLLIAVFILAFRNLKRYSWFAFGWLWYIGTLVPVIGLVQVGSQAMADRYTYIPLIGLFIIITWGVSELTSRRRHRIAWLSITSSIILVFLIGITLFQLRFWANSITLFDRTLQVTSNNYITHNNLGLALAEQGRFQESINHYLAALKINPKYAEAYYNLGTLLGKLGRTEEAIRLFVEALRLKPGYSDAHNNLGTALTSRGKTEEAIRHFSEALKINPDNAYAHYNIGATLNSQGKTEEAIRHFSEALKIDPGFAEARIELNKLLPFRKQEIPSEGGM